MTEHFIAVAPLDLLGGVDGIAGVIVEITARLLIIDGVTDGIVGVIRVRHIVAADEATGIGQVEVADMALDRERCLAPMIERILAAEVLYLEVAEARIQIGVAGRMLGFFGRKNAV